MRGYTKLPNDVLLDGRLSFGARITYAALIHFAWRAGREKESDPPVVLPPLDAIAESVGCSRSGLKNYVAELKREGIVFTRRLGSTTYAYLIFDGPCRSDSDRQERRRRSDSDPQLGQILTATRARTSHRGSSRAKDKSEYGETDVSPADDQIATPDDLPAKAPRLTKIDRRNFPMDALAEETDTDPAGGRVGELNAALNGRAGQPGIRDQFWRECVRHTQLDPRLLPVLLENVESARWEKSLANAVRRKAALYRAKMPDATLTPTALRKWWTDLERMPDPRRGAGVTPAEIRARGKAA